MNPVVAQRRLRAELRRLRAQANLTQRDVAERLDWSPSKVIRIEAGAVGISRTDLWALLNLYGVADKTEIEKLTGLSKVSRAHAWWDEFKPYFSQHFINFIATEASATIIRQFQSLTIPGLLQTSSYAHAIIKAFTNPAQVEPVMRARLARQQVLTQDETPELFFILDEATLHRQVGGPEVMREQLLHLRELDKRPNIHIQVVTYDRGEHPGMRGSFSIFEFPTDNGDDQVVYVERLRGNDLIQNDPEAISSYMETFLELESIASPKEEFDSILARILNE